MTSYAFDDFELDGERLELRRAGRVVKADAVVLRLLHALLREADRLVTKDALIDEVWSGRAVADNVLTVSMARLRKTLGHVRGGHEPIETAYGRGYRFTRPVHERAVAARTPSAPPIAIAAPAPDAARALPYVGRHAAIARMRDAMMRAQAGRGGACALLGEAGIGKTRAAETMLAIAREAGLVTAWSACREGSETAPLAPWLRVLAELGVQPPKHTTRDALISAIARAAASAPCAIVLDDAHRADAASLDLLDALVEEIARHRILLIVTLRCAHGARVPRPDTHLPHALGHRNCERIELSRLHYAEVAQYVRALVDGADERLARAIFAKSEGNPFFMSELTQPLAYAAQVSADAIEVPRSALDLVRQPLAQLQPDTLELLRIAAVLGRDFDLGTLAHVAQRDPSAIASCLDEAIAEGVVVAAAGSRTAFAFSHELLRAVLYDELDLARRRRIHLDIGNALATRSGTGEAVAPSELAYHFRAALPHSDPRVVVAHCREAARAAAAVFAGLDVVRYMRHALEALALLESPSARLRMQLELGIALYARANASREHTRALREAVRLAGELGDPATLVHAARMQVHLPGFRPTPGARAALERALQLLDGSTREDALELRAVALAMLACTPPYAFDAERAHAHVEAAVALARQCGKPQVVHPVLRTQLYFVAMDRAASERIELELEQLAQQHLAELPVLPAELRLRRAVSALSRVDHDAVTRALESAQARCSALNGGELLWHCERMRAVQRYNLGECAQAADALRELHRRAEQRALLNAETLCAFDRAVILRELEDGGALDERDHAALMPHADDPPSVWSLKTRALSAAGLEPAARAALCSVAPPALARLPKDADYLGTLAQLSHAAIVLHELDYAGALYALLLPHAHAFAVQVSFRMEGAVAALLGELAHALGRGHDAIAHLEQGSARNEAAGLLPSTVFAQLALARARAAAGDLAGARAAAQHAEALASRLQLKRSAREAAAF